jgi:hypothetical protein
MKYHPRWAVTALFIVALGVSSVANASDVMFSRLGGAAVYDATTNLTWTSNANINGQMDWNTANTWANTLVLDGVSGWSLPTTMQPDATCEINNSSGSDGLNCTGSELGNLFYNALGGVANDSITTTHNANYGLFSNFQPSYYWSGTEYAPNTSGAWFFGFNSGVQSFWGKSNYSNLYALAVRPGDVAAVPVPAAVWLFGSGLLGLIGMARRKAA